MGFVFCGVVEDFVKLVIGWRLRVYWFLDKVWYVGWVKDYNKNEEMYVIVYDDGEEEEVDIVKEKVEWFLEFEIVENGGGCKWFKCCLNEGVNFDLEFNRGYLSIGDELVGGIVVMEEEKEGRLRWGWSRW